MGDVVRRGTKDRPRFYLRYVDVDGQRRQRVAKGAQTLAEARVVLAAAELRVTQGKVGIEDPTPLTVEERSRATITVADLAARFLGDVEDVPGYAPPSIKSIDNYRLRARSMIKVRIVPALGSRIAASLKVADVERFRDALLERKHKTKDEKLKRASVVQTLAMLSKIYNWARRVGLVDCANPVQGVERPRLTPTVDFLDKGEVGRLLTTADDVGVVGVASWQALALGPMVATALFTGMRKGELFGLAWRDVHLDVGRIDVMRSYDLLPKSGKPRHLPIHPELVRVLREWKRLCPATKEDLVFPVEVPPLGGRSKKLRPTELRMGVKLDTFDLGALFKRAACHVPVDSKPWHLLRHTFASHAVMSGTSLYEVQVLLGHATPSMTQRYAHLAPDHLASAVARLQFTRPSSAQVIDIGSARETAKS